MGTMRPHTGAGNGLPPSSKKEVPKGFNPPEGFLPPEVLAAAREDGEVVVMPEGEGPPNNEYPELGGGEGGGDFGEEPPDGQPPYGQPPDQGAPGVGGDTPPPWIQDVLERQMKNEAVKELFQVDGDLDMKTETSIHTLLPLVMQTTAEQAMMLGRRKKLSTIFRENLDRRMISKARRGRLEILASMSIGKSESGGDSSGGMV